MREPREGWRFSGYGCSELKEAGKRIRKIFEENWKNKKIETEAWTELSLDLVASFAKDGALVEARPSRDRRDLGVPFRRNSKKEFASFDMLHSSNPIYEETKEDLDSYYSRLIKQPFEIFLAMESEWGKSNSCRATRHEVIEDAIKLTIVRARAKIMIFGPTKASEADSLFRDLAVLRENAGDTSPWLLVSNPWKDWGPKVKPIRCHGSKPCANCAMEPL